MRYFTPKPAPHGVPVGPYQIVHIGKDVTVRYFMPISRRADKLGSESTKQKARAASRLTVLPHKTSVVIEVVTTFSSFQVP